MSVSAHPRFLRRRTRVREHRARLHLRRALLVLLAVCAVWAVAWIAQSPLFSVASIQIDGVRRADVGAVLEQHDVYPGRPLILIRTGAVEDSLAADPWVKNATVHRRFPDQVEISITERLEVAVVPVADGWRTVSDDGRVMRTREQRPHSLARVTADVAFAGAGAGAGTEVVSEAMVGIVEFLAALPDDVMSGTLVTAAGTELVAEVADHRVRLGAPTNMVAKAAALVAVLADGRLAPDAIIDLIAPSRPAVSVPPEVVPVEPAAEEEGAT